MAKHKGRRRYRKYLRGAVDEELALGTVSTKTVILGPFDETVNERTSVSSIVASNALSDFTFTATDGPIMVGICHSDYTAAEVEEWIENAGSWNEGDKVAQEVAKRQIKMFGIFRTASTDIIGTAVLNEGKPQKLKLNWILLQGQGLDMWAYNMGASAPAAGSVWHLQGHCNLWPQ